MKKIIIAVTTALTMTLAGCEAPPKTPQENFADACTQVLKDGMKNPNSFKLIEKKYVGVSLLDEDETKLYQKYSQHLKEQTNSLFEAKQLERHTAIIVAEGTNSFGATIRGTYHCTSHIAPGMLETRFKNVFYTMKISQ